MNALRRAARGVILAAACFFVSHAYATAYSTDQSDLWWNPNESGWGMQVVQTGSVIFVTMFVYDQNNNLPGTPRPASQKVSVPTYGPAISISRVDRGSGPYRSIQAQLR
jgi:hypothetical protein